METLIPFLKSSSVVDWCFIILVISIGVILIPVSLWIVIASQRRKPIYLLLIMAFLPLLLALVGTYVRNSKVEVLAASYPEIGARTIAAWRQENSLMTYIGAAGTVVPAVIAVIGLVFKKD